jgi:hypothetical protein
MPLVLKKLVEEGLPVKGLVIGEGPFTSKLSKVALLRSCVIHTTQCALSIQEEVAQMNSLFFIINMTLQLPNVQCLGWKSGLELEEAYASSDVLV